MTRVALYVRVSTEEQAKSGYSIPEQLRTLREYARRENLEVVEEIVDEGYSGAKMDRPGLRRLIELAESGEIAAAVAIKRDRFFRKQLYRLMLDEDLKPHGVTLVALDDTGHKIGDAVSDSFAEWERDVITERTMNGKRSKARAGLVVGGHTRPLGFRYKDGTYEPVEAEAGIVRRIVESIAGGGSIRAVRNALEEEGVPTPQGGTVWDRKLVKNAVLSDLYKPHTRDDLRELGVAEDVLARLEGDVWGVYTYDGIAVPVPDLGIPLETVLKARSSLSRNKTPSKANGRTWELSGGVLRCSGCGRFMSPDTAKANGKTYTYYRCRTVWEGPADRCEVGGRRHPAETLEKRVWAATVAMFDPFDEFRDRLRGRYEEQARELRRSGSHHTQIWAALAEVDQRRSRAYDALLDSDLDAGILKAKIAAMDAEERGLREELEQAKDRGTRLKELEADYREALDFLVDLEEDYRDGVDEIGEWVANRSPEKRLQKYRSIGLTVYIDHDGELRMELLGRSGRWSRQGRRHTTPHLHPTPPPT